MVDILQFYQYEDFLSAAGALDLLAFASGFELEDKGWVPKVSKGDGKDVSEVISLVSRASTIDGLATVRQTLDEKVKQVKYYQDKVEKYGVYLYTKINGETNARHALVVSLVYELDGSPFQGASADGYFYQVLTLRVTRKPEWEPPSMGEYITGPGETDLIGGMFDYSTYVSNPGAVTGDLPARLAAVEFSTLETYPLAKFWVGFRTERFGARANFQSYWSLRKSILFDADTTGSTSYYDTTAQDNYHARTIFSYTALRRRCTIRVIDVSPTYYAEQRGHFTVLLRARLTASGVVRVRLADGIYNTLTSTMTGRVQGRIPITSTSWNFYELGSVQIPSPGRLIAGIYALKNYAMGIDAERVSGSCNLDYDVLIPIPDNEGFVYADGGNCAFAGGNISPLVVQEHADGTKDSFALNSTQIVNTGLPIINGGLPTGLGLYVIAGQRETSSVKGDTIRMDMHDKRRWLSMRGSE